MHDVEEEEEDVAGSVWLSCSYLRVHVVVVSQGLRSRLSGEQHKHMKSCRMPRVPTGSLLLSFSDSSRHLYTRGGRIRKTRKTETEGLGAIRTDIFHRRFVNRI